MRRLHPCIDSLVARSACVCRDAGGGAISGPADPSHRAAGRGQRDRHGGAHSRRAADEEIGQQIIVDDRPGGALTVGLDLTAKSAPDGYTLCMGPIGALAISPHLVEHAALRHRARFSADRAGDARPTVARGVADDAVSVGQGADRLRQAESRQAAQRVVEQRLARPCRRRTVQVHDRNRHRARALQGRRAGDQRSDRRARAADVREPQFDRAVRALGRGAGAGGERRSPLAGISRFADHRRGRRARLFGADLGGVIAPAGVPRPIIDKLNAAINRAIQSGSSRRASPRSATSPPAARRRNSPR